VGKISHCIPLKRKEGRKMKKADWEILHKFRKSEHTCSWCKYCEAYTNPLDIWTEKLSCIKKRSDGAGASTKASFDCDLWKHREDREDRT
jgi:hypothetical protein